MGSSGLSAMIQLGASLENELGMEAITCGRGASAGEDCVLEICGEWLAFRVALHGAEIRLAAALMDGDGTYEMLLRSHDDSAGWDTVKRLVSALEVNQIKALWPRPIEVGRVGDADAWVIG